MCSPYQTVILSTRRRVPGPGYGTPGIYSMNMYVYYMLYDGRVYPVEIPITNWVVFFFAGEAHKPGCLFELRASLTNRGVFFFLPARFTTSVLPPPTNTPHSLTLCPSFAKLITNYKPSHNRPPTNPTPGTSDYRIRRRRRCISHPPGVAFQARFLHNQERGVNTERYVFGKL